MLLVLVLFEHLVHRQSELAAPTASVCSPAETSTREHGSVLGQSMAKLVDGTRNTTLEASDVGELERGAGIGIGIGIGRGSGKGAGAGAGAGRRGGGVRVGFAPKRANEVRRPLM